METTSSAPDARQLQRCLNELVAVLALPATWIDLEPRQIAQTLIDGLVRLLDLEFAYIRSSDSEDGAITECVRSSLQRDIQPHDVASALARCLAAESPAEVLVLPNPVADGLIPTAVFRLGLHDEVGRLIVGSKRPDFPTALEHLVVRVAANQAVVGLSEARHRRRHRQAAEELERALGKERDARLEAERATSQRDEVLAVLAHDLRNPMTSILAAAQMLTVTDENGKRQRQLAIIHRATRTMEGLVRDLLDIARIDAGTFGLNTDVVDVAALIREAVEWFEPQAAGRQIRLAVTVDDTLPRIRADKDRLLQVMSNLLGNALKFSGAGTTIHARATRGEGCVHVAVKDSGAGISAEHLQHVFERFWQADRSSRGSAGLGLAICKAIVGAHGGTIWAASAPGRGTTVHFEIPEGQPGQT